MLILGISAFYHDSAAVLIEDGAIVAAAQEERFTRIKHDAEFPVHAIRFCVERRGIRLADVDFVVFYEKPFLKFERILETYLATAPRGFASFAASLPVWIKGKLFQKSQLLRELRNLSPGDDFSEKLLFGEHHLSHAASAFYPSPFERAAVLTMDGVGEWTTTSLALGNGSELSVLKEIHFPHSLGLLYSAFTYFTGFKVNSGEYKLMGLAPFGEPTYASAIRDHLIDIKDDGSFRLNMEYFDYCTDLKMTSRKFDALFGGPPRDPETEITQREMDLAASIQVVTEEVVTRLALSVLQETGEENLCLAGGVALNCVANGKLLREAGIANVWIQPAAGDAGGALGAALSAHHMHLGQKRTVKPGQDAMQGALLGPEFSQADIRKRLRAVGARFEELEDDEILKATAHALAEGKAVGWFQGRMEFGPRALGARSILADPRSPSMQRQLNLKIKYRESFRPFAPSVMREQVSDWFDLDNDSPYMLLVAEIQDSKRLPQSPENEPESGLARLNRTRSLVPAVTHVDYSARVQTVHSETYPRYHRLLSFFHELTGCPILVNTSFNVRGEPIVCTPEDAFHCFMGTEMDRLTIGNCFLQKEDQNPELKRNYAGAFSLD